MLYMQIFYCLPNLYQMVKCRFRIIPQHECHKFLSSVSGKKIRTALQKGRCRFRHSRDNLITRRVSESIVKHLKMINVKHADREWNLKTCRFIPFDLTVIIMLPSVRNPGQLIDP